MNIKSIEKVTHYKAGYEVRQEVVDGKEFGCKDTIMKSAYTLSGDYIGDKKEAHFLCYKKGIKPEKANPNNNVCSIGFNEKEQKWYGWSHRAIYGFGIGSTCKKGDCHYKPATPQELYDDITKVDEEGYQWQMPENVEITETGVKIKTKMVKSLNSGESISSDLVSKCDAVIDMKGQAVSFEPYEDSSYEIKTGKGEWVAKTLADAREMAIDFADSVS